MAGINRTGERVLPRLSETELAGWLEKWQRAALRVRTGQLVLRIEEGLPYELVVTSTVDVTAAVNSDLARPHLGRYLDRIKMAFQEVKYGYLSVEIADGQMGPLVITSRERR